MKVYNQSEIPSYTDIYRHIPTSYRHHTNTYRHDTDTYWHDTDTYRHIPTWYRHVPTWYRHVGPCRFWQVPFTGGGAKVMRQWKSDKNQIELRGAMFCCKTTTSTFNYEVYFDTYIQDQATKGISIRKIALYFSFSSILCVIHFLPREQEGRNITCTEKNPV